ncbi:MAG TPA: hypothetical protein VLE99_02620 [Candidatus Saccharimonadales bacterium]|nr:hypothetical protein [Candidatus Saccharimonadales bacterium]
MTTVYYHWLLAATYGRGPYNTSTYGGSGTLTNTGIAVVGIVAIAATILLVAMIVRVWRRPRKSTKPDDDPSQ